MGHIVNPIIFRVGIVKSGTTWLSKWYIDKQNNFTFLKFIFEDFYIISYIFNFFKYLKKQSRQVVFTTFSKKIQKKLGTNKFKKRVRFFNYIVQQQSLVVSHIKLIRIFTLNLLKIGIFFFDSTFVVKFNYFLHNLVFYSIFDFKQYKQEQRDKASLLGIEEKRELRKKKRYVRKKVIELLQLRRFRDIKRLFPLNWYENKLKKKMLNYLGVLNNFVHSSIYTRIFKNYFQIKHNNFNLYKVYKNLLWYMLSFRLFFVKKRFNLLFKFLNNFYSFKFSFNTINKLYYDNFILSNKYKKNINLKNYIYNKKFNRFRIKFYFLICKRIFLLIFLIKKYTGFLEQKLQITELNVSTNVVYISNLKQYKLCLKFLNFVYFELHNLRFYYIEQNKLLTYIRDLTFDYKIKIKKFTNFLISVKLRKPINLLGFRRFSRKERKYVKNILFYRNYKNYNFIILYRKKIKMLFNLFKVLFLIYLKKIDLFFFKYLRRFFFKIFIYNIFILLSIIDKKLYFYFLINDERIVDSYLYIYNILNSLLMFLQKQKYLYKKRLLKYSFLYNIRFHLFYVYSLLFKTSTMLYNQQKVDFNYFGLNHKSVTPGVIINYMCKLLKNRYPIGFILRNIIKDLKKYSKYISGFRIICAGRLTKRQRAAFIIKASGTAKLSTIQTNVEYATDIVVLRFGVVGFKVWLAHSVFFIPFFYKIEYNFF